MPIAKFKVKAKSSEMILSDFPLFKRALRNGHILNDV